MTIPKNSDLKKVLEIFKNRQTFDNLDTNLTKALEHAINKGYIPKDGITSFNGSVLVFKEDTNLTAEGESKLLTL